MNIYKTTHRADCPNGGLVDAYKITVESPDMIEVEAIQKCLKEAPKKLFQEQLADLLRKRLGATIKVVGFHHGVKVKCVRK